MFKANQDITSEQCKNNDGVLAVGDEDKKMAQESYHEKLLNTEFVWDRNYLPEADKVTSLHRSKDKAMVQSAK